MFDFLYVVGICVHMLVLWPYELLMSGYMWGSVSVKSVVSGPVGFHVYIYTSVMWDTNVLKFCGVCV